MARVKPYANMFLIFVYITLCFMLMLYFYKERTVALENKNKSLTNQNQQLQSENDYLSSNTIADGEEKKGYHVWPELDKIAERMVNESDGEFKKSWALYLVKESQKYDIDPYLVYELLKVETGRTFNPKLVGPPTKYGRAYGMAQFMKNTAPWIAEMGGLPYEEELLFDPYYSMQLSFIYLDYLHHEYGNWDEALTAYHRGMGGLEKYKKEHGHAESWYAEKIQRKAKSHEAVAVGP